MARSSRPARSARSARSAKRRTVAACVGLVALAALLGALVAPAVATAARGAHGGVDNAVTAVLPRWTSPVADPPTVVRGFDPPDVPWAAGHRGVDLASSAGQEIRAPADGSVSFVGTVVDRGVLTVTHSDGLRSSFEPVSSDLSPGDLVRQGDVVARLDGTPGHCAPLACVHWGVREGDEYRDPMALLRGGPVVLLPLSPARPG